LENGTDLRYINPVGLNKRLSVMWILRVQSVE
jgi:hypothetical protein